MYIDCMLWAGSLTPNGYARVSIKNDMGNWTNAVLHRQLYLALVGDIPYGYVLDHLCGNRCCINIDHLEPVTNTENLNRGKRPNVYTNYCNNGHLLVLYGYYTTTRGSRICKQCNRDRSKKRYLLNKVMRQQE